MHMDPVMPQAVLAVLLILLTGFTLRIFQQPHVIAYLVAGVVIGPWGIGLITDGDVINRLGTMGVVLLLFFVGMETDARKLASNWKVIVFGTMLQIVLSIGCVWGIGLLYAWRIERIILIGFVISLSSTAIIIKLLQDKGIIESKVGQSVLGILLAQDLLIIPMLIILGIFGAESLEPFHMIKQLVGTILAALLFGFILYKQAIHLPLSKLLRNDHELQLFAALGVCFGLAFITAWFELSTALGAFLAGMLIGATKETHWFHHTLDSFKVLFVALFFVSVGMMLDIGFLQNNLPMAILLLAIALITNTFINALILKLAQFNWKDSMFAGVLLSEIGEFSFVLAAVGLQSNIIEEHGYQLALCVISLSLIVSPLWISLGDKLLQTRAK